MTGEHRRHLVEQIRKTLLDLVTETRLQQLFLAVAFLARTAASASAAADPELPADGWAGERRSHAPVADHQGRQPRRGAHVGADAARVVTVEQHPLPRQRRQRY